LGRSKEAPAMKLVWWLVIGAGAAAIGLAALAAAARLSDGPIGPFAGGPFRTGRRLDGPEPDWSFTKAVQTVELQLLHPPRSRTTHILTYRGELFAPCGIVKAGPFVFLGQAFWKRWPSEALADGRVIVRIGEQLYDRHVIKVTDPTVHRELSTLLAEKYGIPLDKPPDIEVAWFFRLSPRSD
jgi:hypothetical protein